MPCKICGSATQARINNLGDDRYGYPGNYAVEVCSACSFGQTAPALPIEKFEDLYTNYYPRKKVTAADVKASAQQNFTPGFRFKEWLLGRDNVCHYFIKSNTKVLDIGCGSGASLLEIKAQGAEAYGTEEDRNIEVVAKDLDLKIFFGQLDQAQIPDDFFDYITLSQVLEHVADPVATLEIIKRKLKTDGVALLSFPNFNSWHLKYAKNKWINWHIPYHQNFFNRRSILKLIRQTGFSLIKFRTVTPRLWNELQWKNIFYAAAPGEQSKVWTAGGNLSFSERIIFNIFHFGSYLFIPLQRIIDLMGFGDSIIISIKKNGL